MERKDYYTDNNCIHLTLLTKKEIMRKTITLLFLLAIGMAATAQVDKSNNIKEAETVYTVLEDAPQFPGGYEALYQYIAANVKYPETAKNKHITGRVLVGFVIEKNGSISNVQLLSCPDESLCEEAVRVVSSMPRWKPGRVQGKKVRAQYTLPINFTLD